MEPTQPSPARGSTEAALPAGVESGSPALLLRRKMEAGRAVWLRLACSSPELGGSFCTTGPSEWADLLSKPAG